MKHNKVPIPANVMEGLEAVRLSGKTNMLDVPMVVKLALDMGFPQTAFWISENRNLYAQGVFSDFESIVALEDTESEGADGLVDQGGSEE